MKKKGYKTLLYVLLFVTLVISLWNRYQLETYKGLHGQQVEENSRLRHEAGEIKNAVVMSHLASIMHLGKRLDWLNVKAFPPAEDSQISNPKKKRLVLVFSELSCNVCQDSETAFAVDIARQFGEDSVIAVVHATEKRYINNFMRLNKINFPVFYCIEDESFFKINGIRNKPMVFVVDDEDRIVAAHFPIPGHPEYSEPIHEFCIQYLKVR